MNKLPQWLWLAGAVLLALWWVKRGPSARNDIAAQTPNANNNSESIRDREQADNGGSATALPQLIHGIRLDDPANRF